MASTSCRKEYAREYYQRTREKQLARAKAHRDANLEECKRKRKAHYHANREKRLAETKQWAAEHPELRKAAVRRWHLKTKYGLTEEQFDAMLVEQGNSCAICRLEEPGGRYKKWHIDHCHKTGKVRGLLCAGCNTMLGHAKDSVKTLGEAIGYLQRNT